MVSTGETALGILYCDLSGEEMRQFHLYPSHRSDEAWACFTVWELFSWAYQWSIFHWNCDDCVH